MAKDGRRILVVDDEPELTRMLQVMFEHFGFEVQRAHGTAQGMAALATTVPDLVILDFMMPHLNGIELCSYIRRDPRTAQVPILIYSAVNSDEKIQAALAAGATRFVPKTIASEELVKIVHEVLA
jgi:DNA-binding response OmpR family regulator